MRRAMLAVAVALVLALVVGVAAVGAFSYSQLGSTADINAGTGQWAVTPAMSLQGTQMVVEVRPGYVDSWGIPRYISSCVKYAGSVGNSVTGTCQGATSVATWIYRASDMFVLDYVCDGPACQ